MTYVFWLRVLRTISYTLVDAFIAICLTRMSFFRAVISRLLGTSVQVFLEMEKIHLLHKFLISPSLQLVIITY